MRRGLRQELRDLLAAPLRLTIFQDDVSTRLGLTSMETERVEMALRYVSGRLLDVGCGRNTLVHRYGSERGIGVDVFDFGGGALIVRETHRLPFPDRSFDTVSFLANLNHIPNRAAVLSETHRVLRDDGRLLVTMINPLLGWLGHRVFWWHDPDRQREMEAGEVYGIWPRDVTRVAAAAGFALERRGRFVYGLNNLFIFRKAASPGFPKPEAP